LTQISRRSALGAVAAVAAGAMIASEARAGVLGRTGTEIPMYRNGKDPIEGAVSASGYNWQAVSFTSQTSAFYGGLLQESDVVYARWVIAWRPRAGAVPTGVRLIKFDFGPSNVEEIARFERTNQFNPVVDAVEITHVLRAIVAARQTKVFTFQTRGNGANGCQLYSSWIEVVWG
jgi:hypothetical protein